MRGHYYHYGLGAHSKVDQKTDIDKNLKAVEEECANRRKLSEDLELKRARIANGTEPGYKNGEPYKES